jgi:uncharacterized protein YeaO (DUF488 family)
MMAVMSIRLKRVYDPPAKDDGFRVLVDRVWPRGISRQQLQVEDWPKDVAPSTELRRWFGHDPRRWDEFRKRYGEELAGQGEALERLVARARQGRLTLVFAAKDARHNNAVVLKEHLERRLRDEAPGQGEDGSRC